MQPTARRRETTGTSAQPDDLPYDRRCRDCGYPIMMMLTPDGWKPFERLVSNTGKFPRWVPHVHKAPVLYPEPIRRERRSPPTKC